MKRNQNFDHNHSQKVFSCRYNMDTNRVEARFEDAPPFPLIVSPLRTSTATLRHSGQNWTGYYITSLWITPGLCWGGEIGHYLSLGCDHGRLED